MELLHDNVSCIYVFDDGVKMTFDSVISNQFYGLEEQIMGNLGTVEPEKGKYYFESIPPAPGFLQMINDWENKFSLHMPYTYFRKKIFRKYVLIFTFFYMIGRRFCSSSVSELVFQGVPF